MAFKFVFFAATLAYANAGLLGAPAVATYSAAPAVSSSYLHQAAPALSVAHAAPVVSAYSSPLLTKSIAPVVSSYAHAAPIVSAYSHAPVVSSYAHSAPVVSSYAHAAPVVSAYSHAPVVSAYAHAPVAVHAPAIGASQQSVVRSLGGAQAVSHYSKAVDSAFSSVRKYDTRITNDALSYAHAPVAVAHAAPIAHAYAQPALSHYAQPALAHGLSAYASGPVVTKTASLAYSPAAVVSHASFSGYGVNYGW